MTITYRTTDNGKWGAGSGANLTPAQVDNNFWSLHERLLELELYPPEGVTIVDITLVGDQMTILLSDTSTIGPLTVPTAAFEWTDEFQAAHDYKPFDLLIANDKLYMVLNAHTSGANFVMGPNYRYLYDLPRAFDVALFVAQRPGYGIPSGEPIAAFLSVRDWFLLENAPGSMARLRVASGAPLQLVVMQNDTEIGTITFSSGNPEGVFDINEVQFTSGDVLVIIGPEEVDSLAKDLAITFAGKLGTLP